MQLVETPGLDPPGTPLLHVAESLPAPQRQRLAEHEGGPVRVVGAVEQRPRAFGGALEALGVDLVVSHRQPVAGRQGLDRPRAQHLAEPDHAPLDHLRPRGRRLVLPQHLRQLVGAEHLARPDGHGREDRSVAPPQDGGDTIDAQRAENCDTHASTVDLPQRCVNTRDTAVIPGGDVVTPGCWRTDLKPQCHPSTEYRKGTILMNTNSNHRPVSIALALAAAASIVTVIGSAGVANATIASEPRGGKVTSDSVKTGTYADPLAALGGQSLAQYLADHWAHAVAAGV